MFKNIIISALTALIYTGCGVSDIVKSLPNNYVYMSEAPVQKWIMHNPLGINSSNYIPCKIEKYTYDNKYIIAKIKFHYDMHCAVGYDESKTLKEGKIYYYIIDTSKDIRYGPFETKKAFDKQKQNLGVKLKL